MVHAEAELAVEETLHMVVGLPAPVEKCDVVVEMGDVVRHGSLLG